MNRNLVQRALLLAALLAVGALAASAQDWAGSARIQGVVQDEQGNPIAGAKITLSPVKAPGTGPQPLTTDAKGKWAYLGLAGGEWKLVIEKEGYATSEGVLPVSAGLSHPPRTITLRQATPAAAAQPGAQPAQPNKGDAIRGYIQKGNELLQSKQYAAARAEYEKAIAELPAEQHPALLRGVAQTYQQEGNHAAARAEYQKANAGLPPAEQVPNLRGIAQSWYAEGKAQEAIDTLKSALEIAPADAETLQLLINVLAASGREAESQQYIARLPQGQKVDPNILLNLGIEAYNKKDLEAALGKFDQVVRDHPDVPDTYYYRGLVYLNQGKNKEAAADFQKLLQIAPNHANAKEAKEFLDYLKTQS